MVLTHLKLGDLVALPPAGPTIVTIIDAPLASDNLRALD